jgi:small subunit ribosomal protein S6
MSLYECVFIARQDISATQVEALVGQFTGIIDEGGGKVASSEMWGLRSLAYRIKKNRKGHYVLLNLDAPSPAVQEMERIMRLNEDVIRYLTVRVEALEEGPSIVMQSRHSRDDRGGRGGRGGGFRGGGGGGGGGGFRGDGPPRSGPRDAAPAATPTEAKPAENKPAENKSAEQAEPKTEEKETAE